LLSGEHVDNLALGRGKPSLVRVTTTVALGPQ
jgi:hypothetical protein